VLVFLPGRREIAACQRALAGNQLERRGWRSSPLHGNLRLAEQSRAIQAGRPSLTGKVVLATSHRRELAHDRRGATW
jgi:HrpA-like RNA helicase